MGVTSRQMKLNQCHAAVTAAVATARLWQLWLEKGELCGLAKNVEFKNLPSVVLSPSCADAWWIRFSGLKSWKSGYRAEKHGANNSNTALLEPKAPSFSSSSVLMSQFRRGAIGSASHAQSKLIYNQLKFFTERWSHATKVCLNNPFFVWMTEDSF